MVNELLLNEDGELWHNYTDSEQRQQSTLVPITGADDEIWRKFGHKHLAGQSDSPLGDLVGDYYKDFQRKNAVFFNSGSKSSAAEAKEQIMKLSAFQKQKAMLSSHVGIVERLAKEYCDTSRQLDALCTFESDLTSGRDQFQDKLSSTELKDRCTKLLTDLGSWEDKMRLICTFWFCLGAKLPASSLNELEKSAFPTGFPSGCGSQCEGIMDSLRKWSLAINLDAKSEKFGHGHKRMVSYGYGDHRRRHTTEVTGDERDPLHTESHLTRSTTTIDKADELSRFKPTLYWLIKDLLQVSVVSIP